MVWVRVDPKDMGETKKCQVDTLPLNLDQNNYPCISYTIPQSEGPLYLGVYVHFDGYDRDGVGETLRKYFTEYEQVLNLILLGSLRYVHYFTGICAYHNWRNDKVRISRCVPDTRENFIRILETSDYLYEYVFEDGQWLVIC